MRPRHAPPCCGMPPHVLPGPVGCRARGLRRPGRLRNRLREWPHLCNRRRSGPPGAGRSPGARTGDARRLLARRAAPTLHGPRVQAPLAGPRLRGLLLRTAGHPGLLRRACDILFCPLSL
eukprot:176776-Prymnesium_polylepis.1